MKHSCCKISLLLIVASAIGFPFLLDYWTCHPPIVLEFGGGKKEIPQRCLEERKQQQRKRDMKTMEELQANLAFTCKQEEHPPLSQDTQQLYHYARYHDLHNMWTGKKGDAVWQQMAVYYRIAAANGDYKANVRLQYLLESGRVTSDTPQTDVHELNKLLAEQLPATAYYKLYGYLDVGFGVRTEKDGQFAYLRKAADMGSREAQYVVARKLMEIDDPETGKFRSEISEQMWRCASEQGLGIASQELGIGFKLKKKYQDAVDYFHQGVKNGDSQSAFRLSNGFDKKNTANNETNYLGLEPDAERKARYEIIWSYLYDNDYLQPKVPDLDKIVPLPPAKLPPWDGKIEFQRWYEGASPPKPSDELVQRLAAQAGLDWQTGLPLKK